MGEPSPSALLAVGRRPGFILTGMRVQGLDEEFARLYSAARELCPDQFIAEETRELHAAYGEVSLRLIDRLRTELAQALRVPETFFSRDRFSMHGCGPVGLHDDFFRYPYVYFTIVVVHSGALGLVGGEGRAKPHRAGDIILLDPRAKHALVPEGTSAHEHVYDRSHGPQREAERQFMFLDFDVRRPDLRRFFRHTSPQPAVAR